MFSTLLYWSKSQVSTLECVYFDKKAAIQKLHYNILDTYYFIIYEWYLLLVS